MSSGECFAGTPSLVAFLAGLQAFTPEPLDVDRPVFDQQGIDSLDVVNWLYAVLEDLGIELEDDMEEVVETGSLRQLHAALIALEPKR